MATHQEVQPTVEQVLRHLYKFNFSDSCLILESARKQLDHLYNAKISKIKDKPFEEIDN